MARYHVRCSNYKCKTRHVFKNHPDCYGNKKKCRKCGNTKFTVDVWMNSRDTRAMGCMCAGYPWAGLMSGAMHRKGSKYCWYRKDGTQRMPGDEDFHDLEYEKYAA
jgi:hypothetical protein